MIASETVDTDSVAATYPQTNPVLYIKLGKGGQWASEALSKDDPRSGTLILGYQEIPAELLQGDTPWDDARTEAMRQVLLRDPDMTSGTATDHVRQIKLFYTADATVIWCSFVHQQLYWCRAEPDIARLSDGRHVRPTIGGWSNLDRLHRPLDMRRLSGKLTKVAAYKQTICTVAARDYLLTKLDGEDTRSAKAAKAARETLVKTLEPIIANLDPADFEILVDLIFRGSGLRLDGARGRQQPEIDLDLSSPLTKGRVQVQVKSQAGRAEFEKLRIDTDGLGLEHAYLAASNLHGIDDGHRQGVVEVIGPRRVAELSEAVGLSEWLIAKAS